MTAQEVFNTAVERIIAQGRPGFDATHGRCEYRTDGGNKCAVGVLLDDKELAYVLSDHAIAMAGVNTLHAQGYLPERLSEHIRLLNALQQVHDRAADIEACEGNSFIEEFKRHAFNLAHRFGFELPPVLR
jgi:hypothetical protein